MAGEIPQPGREPERPPSRQTGPTQAAQPPFPQAERRPEQRSSRQAERPPSSQAEQPPSRQTGQTQAAQPPSPQSEQRPEKPPSRRERARAATIGEIKQTALGLMREQGTTDFRFSDIARLMGMTAPALYRYFADRDELLTELIVDAYNDLGEAVADARDQIPVDDPGGRFTAVAQSYRRWAREEPQRFALILGMPVPGYHAPEEGPTTEAARRAMAQLKSLFYEATQAGLLRRPMLADDDGGIARMLAEHHEAKDLPIDGPPVAPETFQAMLHCWASLHGFTCLESYGHLDWMPGELRDAIFDSSIRLIAKVAGLPEPGQPPAP